MLTCVRASYLTMLRISVDAYREFVSQLAQRTTVMCVAQCKDERSEFPLGDVQHVVAMCKLRRNDSRYALRVCAARNTARMCVVRYAVQ